MGQQGVPRVSEMTCRALWSHCSLSLKLEAGV